jgi:Esterase-like activity of phytase
MIKQAAWALTVTAAAWGLTGCGETEIEGQFLDSAVEGLSYSSNNFSGVTDAAGGFMCNLGEQVTFKAGDVDLGSAACGETITPLDVAGSSDATSDAVVNRLLFLQALDHDDNPSNGITLSTAVRQAMAGKSLNFAKAATDFNTDLTAALPDVTDSFGKKIKYRANFDDRRKGAVEHFTGTLAAIGSSKGSSRSVEVSSAGGAVVITSYSLQANDSQYVPYPGALDAVKADFPKGFFPAVGSGLAFKGVAADGSLEFWGTTDRGPNGDGPAVNQTIDTVTYKASKIFPAPAFVPSLAVISVGKKGARIESMLPLKVSAGQTVSGRPLASGVGSSGELPLNDALTMLSAGFDANGIDPEAVVVDSKRNVLWMSDEYGPFILKVDPTTGVILDKFSPSNGLPAVLQKRRANRGMEGLALDAAGKVHGFLQSPIDDGKSASDPLNLDLDSPSDTTDKLNVKDYAQLLRWVEFDPETKISKSYAYPVQFPVGGQKWDRNRSGSIKLGDMVNVAPGKFVVIEQGKDFAGAIRNFLMLVEIPAEATDIAGLGSELEKNSIDGTTSSATPWASVVPLKKTLLMDLNAAGWLAEKAEGLTLVDERTLALINDNDFGVRTAMFGANGVELPTSIEDCTATELGVISGSGCGVSARVVRGLDKERATRLWLMKFPKAINSYTVQ